MIVFIITSISVGLMAFYLLYMQVFEKVFNSNKQFLIHSIVFVSIYSLMLNLGYSIANTLTNLISFSGIWISVFLFFFLGLKMFVSIKKQKSNKIFFDTSKIKTLVLYALTYSFDIFIAGLALGFYNKYSFSNIAIFIIIVFILLFLAYKMAAMKNANKSVWLIASLGSSLMGINSIIIIISWLLS